MKNVCHPTASGRLFDLYLDGDVVRLWFIGEDGKCVSLWDTYAPSFYVRTTAAALRRAFQRRPLNSIPVTITPVERIELQSGKYVPVLEVKVQRPSRYNEVVSILDKWGEGQLEQFTCDISIPQRYLWDKKIFPLAFCSWEASGDGRLISISSLDDPWSVDYKIPPLNIMEMKVEGDLINPRHGNNGRLELLCDGESRVIEGDTPELFLETFFRILQQCDPDVIISYWGDSYHIPLLQQMERQYRIPLSLHREMVCPSGDSTPPSPPLNKGRELSRRGKSYFSYGRIVRRENAFYLAGRWHLDMKNSFIMQESGLEGIIELARISSIPVQSLARSSIGTVISAMQMHQAYKEGILIPWRKQEPETFKTAEELITSDKGGLIFMPEPGIYGDVAELDFASLYPTIMAKYNISQETLDCECCPQHVAPETGRHTCTKREGLIPRVLKPILKKRAEYKKMMGGTEQRTTLTKGHKNGIILRQAQDDKHGVMVSLSNHDGQSGVFSDEDRLRFKQRQTALKWILVTCFGYLGYKNARFGRIEAHEAVTAYGRELLLRAKEIAEAEGFTLIHGIVDSIWVYKKGITDQDAVMLSDKITKETGITMALEGIYRWLMFPVSKMRPNLAVSNRYLGVFRNGEMKVRGIEMRRHDTPPFIAKAQKEMIAVLAQARSPEELSRYVDSALEVMENYMIQLSDGRVSPMELSISKHLTKRPEDYDRAIDTSIAAQSLLARGIRLEPGENIQMIITSAGDKDPASRVRPLSFAAAGHSFDREKYTELLFNAAETVLKPLGCDVKSLKETLLSKLFLF